MLHPNFHPFPQLETERLLLRQVQDLDADDLFILRSDQTLMRYIDRPLASSIDDALEFIRKIHDSLIQDNGITWAITIKPDHRLIGTIGFWRIEKENYRAEIGYILQEQAQGKGIMHEALKAILDYGFQEMRLHSVEANVNPSNLASIRLLEKNHFIREAYFRENYFYNGRYIDSAIYSLINPHQ
ncbi:MAG TPA: GNAT family N-acetyltransferase [Chitinophagaceae bacterium]|nr:GNAT family N-acetyltransferase [Chitinophagaceae bacterium]